MNLQRRRLCKEKSLKRKQKADLLAIELPSAKTFRPLLPAPPREDPEAIMRQAFTDFTHIDLAMEETCRPFMPSFFDSAFQNKVSSIQHISNREGAVHETSHAF